VVSRFWGFLGEGSSKNRGGGGDPFIFNPKTTTGVTYLLFFGNPLLYFYYFLKGALNKKNMGLDLGPRRVFD
jgi:hypothetical protein